MMTNIHLAEMSSLSEKESGEPKSRNGMTFYIYCFIILLYLFPTLLIRIGLEVFDDPPKRSIRLETQAAFPEPEKMIPKNSPKELLPDEQNFSNSDRDTLETNSDESVPGNEEQEKSESISENKDERGWYLPFEKVPEKTGLQKEK